MADPFESFPTLLDSPAVDGFAVSPSDVADLARGARCIYVGGSGDVRLTTPSNAVLTFVGVAGGSILPVRAIRIHATGTTATDMIGLI